MSRDDIMKFLDSHKQDLKTKTDIQIYDFICENLYIKDFQMARQCSIYFWKSLH